MYSIKKNVLRVVASLDAYDIHHVVVSPGSRNAPFIHTFTQHSAFTCHCVVDERSAAFYALGLALKLQSPVAICCTSGTALLNYASAIAEAYYQQIPLVILSADRSPAWIGQMDGQTLPQIAAFGSLVKKSIQLPEIHTAEDDWYCQRLIHEALLDCSRDNKGPVHINIPISEPLFDFSATDLPKVSPIQYIDAQSSTKHYSACLNSWTKAKKIMIVLGQLPKNVKLREVITQLAEQHNCVILAEHLANIHSSMLIGDFDAILQQCDAKSKESLVPDIVISVGGHIVSKQLKQFLRKYKSKEHWHLTDSGMLVDLFQNLTHLIKCDYLTFLTYLLEHSTNQPERSFERKEYLSTWQQQSSQIITPNYQNEFSDIFAIGEFLKKIPMNSALHLANSSSVRNAQLFKIDESISVFCNRGTNGIDGTISTASGFASIYAGLSFLIIGDLSFFYDLNALWNNQLSKNMRILLINNGGGGIFHQLQGLNQSPALDCISAHHQTIAKDWAKAAQIHYLSAKNITEFYENIAVFTTNDFDTAVLFEIIVET